MYNNYFEILYHIFLKEKYVAKLRILAYGIYPVMDICRNKVHVCSHLPDLLLLHEFFTSLLKVHWTYGEFLSDAVSGSNATERLQSVPRPYSWWP